ncbi:alpha/beta hydrolase [Flavilitoribacter nigricans]|uniref:Esterase n=1 Tax=Flavilitoribacter nigricans (strain ATCC 23147 / DSM 23189 / NBRC 102662 / NCIMB 1420 / SS-2) TaxID=1122177 RepID=A0A2D0NA62_FLAN2|nr:alpha/beta hydrolase-fold protein [Flavilitoribacter nigricans]PHN05367.1 esterase [Flavilitoribacter nigricans DSM 23189 = NBRC 102662]
MYSKISIPCLLLFALGITQSVFAQTHRTEALNAGEKIAKNIAASEAHNYTANLENGMAIVGELRQEGIDLVIDVYHPNGQLLKQIDSPNGTQGSEPIDITAKASGTYTFTVHSLDQDAKTGSYTLQIERILSLAENAKRITRKELPTATLYQLWESSLSDSQAVDTFLADQTQQHIIEPIEGNADEMLVTYFCVPRANTEYVMLSGGPDFLGLRFQRLPGTKLFFVTQRVPRDARFNYGFNYFNLDKAGPQGEIESRNVKHAYDGTVEMPDAPQQVYLLEREDSPQGKLVPTTVKSEILKEERQISVHIPAGYDAAVPHNLLIIFDGEAYGARPGRRSRIPAPTILDNLAADGKISPTVTVLVWSMGKRSKDLISDKFGDFIATELIPRMRSEYHIHPEAEKVILAGSSRGGFAASYIAFRHSEVIGKVLSQSGSYWIKGTEDENHWIYPEENGKLIELYKQSKTLPIQFYMDIGLYDAGASMLGMNRQFRDILEVKGYEVDYREFKGGHNYVNWRGTLADGLISLIGTGKE